MKTRRRNYSDDRLTITRRKKRSKKTDGTTENSKESIPIDLIIEIFSRLPAKSVARFHCMSKLWSSVFSSPYFTEQFLTRSRTRPQLLFACKKQGKFLFFSSPQPQNPDANSSHVICANELFSYPFDAECCISGTNGLICLIHQRVLRIMKEIEPVICNPTTGQFLTLPKLKFMRGLFMNFFFGYDPIDKLFKVLFMWSTKDFGFDEYRILTIGGSGKKLSWRIIESCVPPHYSFDEGIFINGVLYYRAMKDGFRKHSMIVCFDVRSEKFSLVTIPKDSIRVASKGKLINYNGKLGSIVSDTCGDIDGRYGRSGGSIELWVMEDAEKSEWSKHTYVLPTMWQNILGMDYLHFFGVTQTKEIVFTPTECMPSCVIYYNIERNTIVKVGIQEIEDVNGGDYVYKFLDHVEDVKYFTWDFYNKPNIKLL